MASLIVRAIPDIEINNHAKIKCIPYKCQSFFICQSMNAATVILQWTNIVYAWCNKIVNVLKRRRIDIKVASSIVGQKYLPPFKEIFLVWCKAIYFLLLYD